MSDAARERRRKVRLCVTVLITALVPAGCRCAAERPTAAAPEGPFSPRRKIWDCYRPPDDPDSVCDAAKEHPQFASEEGRIITLTYNTNSSEHALRENPALYWPRMFRFDLSAVR